MEEGNNEEVIIDDEDREELRRIVERTNMGNRDLELKKELEQKYAMSQQVRLNLVENKKRLGEIFELVFKSMLKNAGLKEQEDFFDMRILGKGYPDIFIPMKKMWIEIKASGSNAIASTELQRKRIKLLQEGGYIVKTVFYNIQIKDSFTNNKEVHISDFIKELTTK